MNIRNDRARDFSDALVSEIKAEMGRQDLSSRGLGRLIDKSSQYMSTRLDGGNPRTGERVPLSVADLAAIASALGLTLTALIDRAEVACGERSAAVPDNVVRLPQTGGHVTAMDLIDDAGVVEYHGQAAHKGEHEVDRHPAAGEHPDD